MVKRQRADRSNDIRRAAIKLFVTKGFHATTMEDIAQEVGLLKGSLYYYLSSKDDLIFQLLHTSVDDVMERVEAVVAHGREAGHPPHQLLADLVRTEVAALVDHRYEVQIWVQERGRLPDTCRSIDTSVRTIDQTLLGVLEDGAAVGAWTSKLLNVRFQAIRSMFARLPLWYDERGDLSIDALCDEYANIALAIAESRTKVAI